MLIKAMTVFLVVMAALAMFGKLRLPRRRKGAPRLGAGTCSACGRPLIGPGRCPCTTRNKG